MFSFKRVHVVLTLTPIKALPLLDIFGGVTSTTVDKNVDTFQGVAVSERRLWEEGLGLSVVRQLWIVGLVLRVGIGHPIEVQAGTHPNLTLLRQRQHYQKLSSGNIKSFQ